MPRRFAHPQYPGRPVHSHAMAALLGVEGNYPASGLPGRFLQGIWVWVDPLPPRQPGERKRSTHRVLCECPDCGQRLSAGRLHQHTCPTAPRPLGSPPTHAAIEEEGWKANYAGLARWHNPYTPSCDAWRLAWWAGWDEARGERENA